MRAPRASLAALPDSLFGRENRWSQAGWWRIREGRVWRSSPNRERASVLEGAELGGTWRIDDGVRPLVGTFLSASDRHQFKATEA